MAKVTFTVESDATLQTIFVLPASDPSAGQFVTLKKKGSGRTRSVDLDAGRHHYLLRLEAGAPEADWTLTVQREGRQPVKREGELNSKGDGGDVGQITVF